MQKPRWILSAILALGGLVSCAGDDAATPRASTPSQTTASASASPTGAPLDADAILIEERITNASLHTGEVLATSMIGEQPFCRGGKSSGSSAGATITETFQCPGGTLTLWFSPTQRSLVQGATWSIKSGTGRFAGMRGGGSMVSRFDPNDPDVGLVTFAGLVGR